MSNSILLGNIDKSYCSLFWLYSIFALVGLVAFLGLNIFRGVSKKKSASFYLGIVVTASAFFIIYLQNQLFYNMCKNSVQLYFHRTLFHINNKPFILANQITKDNPNNSMDNITRLFLFFFDQKNVCTGCQQPMETN